MPDPILSLDPMDDSAGFLDRTHLDHGDSRDENFVDGGIIKKKTTNFSFKATITGALTFTIQPGAVELGPDTVIEWASIKDAGGNAISSLQSIPEGNTAWYVWCNIDVTDGSEAAKILSGSSITALTSDEKKYTRQKRLIQATIVSDKITAIKNLQCGNIDIPRL